MTEQPDAVLRRAVGEERLPLPVPPGDAIRGWLRQRVDGCGLSPGIVVGLTEGGRRSSFAYGAADASGKPVDEDTVFEIGSVTKLFTSLLLADMSLRGEVALDEPVAALLPPGTRLPDRNGKPITLLQLARHTSGLPRLPPDVVVGSPDPYAAYTAERPYACLEGLRPARTPGEGWEYSNLGAGLLGHALGLRVGQGYEDLVTDRVLGPLGMAGTAFHLPRALADRFASGHDADGDGTRPWHLGVLAGAGGLRSTVADVLLFLEALLEVGAGPLGPATSLLTTPCDSGGLGLGRPQPEGHVLLQHSGWTRGFRSHVAVVPAWRRGAVVLANASTGACADLCVHLCDSRYALHWFRQPVAMDPACFDRLLGRYRMAPGFVFDVTRHGDRLMVQPTGQAAARVFPSSEWTFFYKHVGAQLTFQPGEDGRAARLVLHQNGQDRMADRIEK